ncbi:MAG: 1-deoxy-D-xylulose-5-phosphate reductoisomerase [bacterium]|nr:1-deoxy-D-xylulose-5-phosphate reductoisomerase [bacterium]
MDDEPQTTPAAALYPFRRPRLTLSSPLRLVLLGATGSIGRQTIDLVRRHPERLELAAVSCHGRVEELAAVLAELAAAQPWAPPPLVAICDENARERAARLPGWGPRLLAAGPAGLVEAVTEARAPSCVVNGLVGAAGLAPTLAAAELGLRIALANKEALVVGGQLVAAAVARGGAELLPVDSEHAAIAQCLSGRDPGEVARLVLTASGGPFRTTPAADLGRVTLEQVLAHPTWRMGPKITVDSATLMNKGLEVIEAHHLFGLPYERIDVVVHPGSIVHSLVEFVDGALLAQLGTPDMRVPLQYAIVGEIHWPLDGGRLDLLRAGPLVFEAPDIARFPCLHLARQAGQAGGTAPVVLNAANEVAVAALLAGRLRFADIPGVIADTLARLPRGPVPDLAAALDADARARTEAAVLVDARDAGGH